MSRARSVLGIGLLVLVGSTSGGCSAGPRVTTPPGDAKSGPAMLGGARRSAAMDAAAQWLGALGLAGMEGRRIGELSGGQAQRVAIARAQILRAEVVFADEPTGALDSETSADTMRALVGSTVGDGRTLVLVTHDAQVAGACDAVVRMRDGALEPSPIAAVAR